MLKLSNVALLYWSWSVRDKVRASWGSHKLEGGKPVLSLFLADARWAVRVQAPTSKQYHSIFCWRSITISASFLVKTPKWSLFVQKRSMYGLKNHLGKQVAQINPHRYSFRDLILVKIFFLAGVCCFYYLCWLCFWKSRYVHFYFYFYFRLNTSCIC